MYKLKSLLNRYYDYVIFVIPLFFFFVTYENFLGRQPDGEFTLIKIFYILFFSASIYFGFRINNIILKIFHFFWLFTILFLTILSGLVTAQWPVN